MRKLLAIKDKPRHLFRDLAIQTLVYLVAACVSGVFLWMLLDLIRGGSALLSWDFLTDVPRDAGRKGGIGSILVSTLLVLLIALLAALPISWAAAVLLAEFIPVMSAFGRWVRYSLQVLAGVPSIVFGLFGYAFFSLYLGMGFSILSGGLTLACMLLPILVSTAEAGLRSVPESYRLSAAALGMSRIATLFHVLLPVAAPAWVAGLLLGIGRAAAETAALMFTSGYVDRMPESLMDSGRVLALHIFDLSMNVPGGDAPAHAAALVLIILLLVINLIAMQLTHLWQRRKLNTE